MICKFLKFYSYNSFIKIVKNILYFQIILLYQNQMIPILFAKLSESLPASSLM
jgi:hypothetical protein